MHSLSVTAEQRRTIEQAFVEGRVCMKGEPAKIFLVHGTWGRGFDSDKEAHQKDVGRLSEPRWFEMG